MLLFYGADVAFSKHQYTTNVLNAAGSEFETKERKGFIFLFNEEKEKSNSHQNILCSKLYMKKIILA